MSKYDLAIILACLAFNILLQVEALQGANSTSIGCGNKLTCHECIQTESCAWCMERDHDDKPRCFQHSHEDSCRVQFIWNPDSKEQIIDNRSLTHVTSDFSKTPNSNQKIAQMRPQHVSLKLRVNQEHFLTFNYSMDLSKSMNDDKEQVSATVQKLSETMHKLTSQFLEMKDDAPLNVSITYQSACLNNGAEKSVAKCDGLKTGDVVSFTAKIEVTSCPTDPKDWNQVIKIHPVGTNESFIIDLEMVCSCPCEHPGSFGYETKSEKCSYYGDLVCGICNCDNTHFGHYCECLTHLDITSINLDYDCRADNTTQIDCSGRGICLCGLCECDRREDADQVIYGKYCECDNFSCERTENLLCSGPNNGFCDCGVCLCKPGWTGSACNCRTSNATCIAPNGKDEICSGHGYCECGKCKCKTTEEGRYSGEYCDKCPTCT